MFNKRGWPRKKILSLIACGFAVSAPGVFSQTGGTGSPDQNTMFTDNVPAQAAETPSYMLNPSFEFGLGNVAGKNYEVWGNKGRAYVKSGLELTKPLWGPLFFLGQAYHSMGLDMPAPSNLLELKLAPLFYFPQFNLLAGFQLYGMIPLYEGRLVADGSQVSDDFLFQNVGNMGINAGAYYMLPLDFGSIYGSLLFTFGRSLVASKWLLQGDLEAGVKTNMGLGGYVSPLFTFLLWGEDPEDNLFSNLEIQINYAKPLFPYSGSLSLLFPGGQKNGLKNNGVSVVPKFQFSYGLLFDVWASVELGGIGRSGGNGVSLSPKVGAVYHYVHSAKNTALSGGDYPPGANDADPRWYIGAAAGYANNQLYTSTAGRTYTE
jgi:hypothetical protein